MYQVRTASVMRYQITTSQGKPARCRAAVRYQPNVAEIRSPTMF